MRLNEITCRNSVPRGDENRSVRRLGDEAFKRPGAAGDGALLRNTDAIFVGGKENLIVVGIVDYHKPSAVSLIAEPFIYVVGGYQTLRHRGWGVRPW